jgi:hypothetical protein
MYMDGDVTQEVARANHMIHPLLLTLTCYRLLQNSPVTVSGRFPARSKETYKPTYPRFLERFCGKSSVGDKGSIVKAASHLAIFREKPRAYSKVAKKRSQGEMSGLLDSRFEVVPRLHAVFPI